MEQLTYKLPEELLECLTDGTNRSNNQTKELFDLCEGNFLKLFELEERIHNLHVCYCPSEKQEVEQVMQMPFDRKKQWWFLKMKTAYKVI